MIAAGSFLSDNDEMFGMPSVLVRDDELTDHFNREKNANLILDDNTAMIYGKEFNIVGTHTSNGLIVPFLSVPEEIPAASLTICFEQIMTRKIYQELVDTAKRVIPGKLIFPELDLPDKESVYIYNNIMMISVLIAALTIINFAFLYNFIFSRRRRLKDYAKYYVLGLQWRQCALVNLLQSLTIGAAALIITCAGLILISASALSKTFAVIWNAPMLLTLLGILAIYLAFSMIMPMIMLRSNTPRALLRSE